MNYQKYGYNRYTKEQVAEYFPGKHSSTESHKLARERGWVSRQDAIDDIYGNGGGYYRRAYILPSSISNWQTGLEATEMNVGESWFHHKVLGMPRNSPFFGSSIDSINLLDLNCVYELQICSTATVLRDVEFKLCVLPDPYPAEISKQDNLDAPEEDSEGNPVVKPNIDYPYTSRVKVYNNTNLRIRRMMEVLNTKINDPCDPFNDVMMDNSIRYIIDEKRYKTVKSGQDGRFVVKFKFKSSPKNGDITLRKNEGIFVVIHCSAECSHTNSFIFKSGSDIRFRYSINKQ